jgi:hypothetical protein
MGWTARFTDFVGTERLAAALHSGDPAYDDIPEHLLDRLEPALQTLLARAVDSGCSRDEVTSREILTTIALIHTPVPASHRASISAWHGCSRATKED